MKSILTAVLLFFSFSGFSQYDVDVIGADFSSGNSGVWVVKNNMDSQIKGNEYIFEDFDQSATVTIKGGKKYKVPHMNYNAQHGQLVARFASDSLFVFNPSNIETVAFEEVTLKPFLDPERKQIQFYGLLGNSGDQYLLKKYTVRLKEGVFNPMTQKKMTSDAYVLHTDYFLADNNKLNLVKLKKRTFKDLFKDNFKEVDRFVEEQNLSYKNEEDLKAIFNYYNELL